MIFGRIMIKMIVGGVGERGEKMLMRCLFFVLITETIMMAIGKKIAFFELPPNHVYTVGGSL